MALPKIVTLNGTTFQDELVTPVTTGGTPNAVVATNDNGYINEGLIDSSSGSLVRGSGSAVVGNFASFNSTDGRKIADSGLSQASFDAAGAAATVQGNLNTHVVLTTAAHGGIVASNDPRLSNARTPTAHASTHSAEGTDEISHNNLGSIQGGTTGEHYHLTSAQHGNLLPTATLNNTLRGNGTNWVASSLLTNNTSNVGVNKTSFGNVEKFGINTALVADHSAVMQLNTGATTSKGLVIQGSSSQTANLQEWQNSSGTKQAAVLSEGSIETSSTSWMYFGDANTDGAWRMGRYGNDFVHQRREYSAWVTKLTVLST